MYSWGDGYSPSPDLVHSLHQVQAKLQLVPGCGQVRACKRGVSAARKGGLACGERASGAKRRLIYY